MCRVALVPVALALISGISGISGAALSQERAPLRERAYAVTLGAYWYYGDREYRCRRFSTVCGYYRPVRYGYYRSNTYADRIAAEREPDTPAKLRQVRVDDVLPGARKTAVMERYGSFARIPAAGNAARWVRSNALVAGR